MKPPIPFPLALNIGTDIVHLPRIARLLTRHNGTYLARFTRRILHPREQADFRARFPLSSSPVPLHNPQTQSQAQPQSQTKSHPHPSPLEFPETITPDMTRWLAGRFAAKEAARKAAPRGAAQLGWKDVIVRVSAVDEGRPEVVYLGASEGDRLGKLSISHDGDYVVAMVLAAG
ncbi:4'-phosphopantetheinyl transferase [Aspergillus japonicus CBS 114.51]|uniref:4'-phosphopantetheinyl transferase n=2 Tax=Aspergillus TaxID=5052 RepID=A0A2V5HNX5_ASPV1|nr:4'-phosphopantetheinyl transferase [Aspergillus japonicus CBS 114.51]PYI24312.1 4'-phosphopantetheinyl transferase [Aspergillus violaceofuscus CBS 115571]RAH82878.1 4'-phosphopantetheinyl transferase [Aspergillus japonicus CBS 114.51]